MQGGGGGRRVVAEESGIGQCVYYQVCFCDTVKKNQLSKKQTRKRILDRLLKVVSLLLHDSLIALPRF